ncbi:MAG: hypothetical protein IAI49_07925 [Candidatus Eremiobacteraeota bacterium]|nr:hypothetical protein [Candidatus Eremiobacteraeota bacterium]
MWRYPLATRIAIGIAAVAMFGFAAIVSSLPVVLPGKDVGSIAAVSVVGAILFGFGVFMCFGLTAVVRTRIAVSADALEAVVPSGHDRLLVPHFRTIRVPLRDIRTVELRTEITSTFGVKNERDALSITTAAGERIGLATDTVGSVSLPVDDIASAVAAAAGTVVTDDGTVLSNAPGLYGAASSTWTEPALGAADAARFRSIARATAQIATALLLFVFLLRALL